jgi:3-hydroxyethyl bacteriochlorophyllide a dehydrogenase
MKIKAVVYQSPGQVGLETFDLAPCREDEILCETIYSFVSPGTELRYLSTHNKTFPCIPGYSYVGRIIEVGGKVKGWHEGELISGRNQPDALNPSGIAAIYGGHVSHHRCVVKGIKANCSPVRLPDKADPWQYVTAEVAAISWHGVSIASPCAGETALVVGQGLIGAFAAKWLLNQGVRVVVTDLEESRLERARRWGATGVVSARDPDARERIQSYFENGVDISVEASSTMAGCRLASSLLKNTLEVSNEESYHLPGLRANPFKWPRMIYLACYTDTVETHPAGLVGREGAVVFRPSDRNVGDRQMVVEFIKQGHLPVSDFVDAALPVEKAPEAYKNLREQPGKYSAAAFHWKD